MKYKVEDFKEGDVLLYEVAGDQLDPIVIEFKSYDDKHIYFRLLYGRDLYKSCKRMGISEVSYIRSIGTKSTFYDVRVNDTLFIHGKELCKCISINKNEDYPIGVDCREKKCDEYCPGGIHYRFKYTMSGWIFPKNDSSIVSHEPAPEPVEIPEIEIPKPEPIDHSKGVPEVNRAREHTEPSMAFILHNVGRTKKIE